MLQETFEHGPTRSRGDGLGAQLCAGAVRLRVPGGRPRKNPGRRKNIADRVTDEVNYRKWFEKASESGRFGASTDRATDEVN